MRTSYEQFVLPSLVLPSILLSDIYIPNKLHLYIEAVARRCSVKKVFLEISPSLQENTCARVSFLIKLKASGLILFVWSVILTVTLLLLSLAGYYTFPGQVTLLNRSIKLILFYIFLYINFVFLIYSRSSLTKIKSFLVL